MSAGMKKHSHLDTIRTSRLLLSNLTYLCTHVVHLWYIVITRYLSSSTPEKAHCEWFSLLLLIFEFGLIEIKNPPGYGTPRARNILTCLRHTRKSYHDIRILPSPD